GAWMTEHRADPELARAACMRRCFSHGILLQFHCCSFPWRNHPNPRTHQDRLIKKLRRKQIGTHAEVNAYLEREYLPEPNRRFARAATRPEDYHRPTPQAAALDKIFRLESPHDQRGLGGAVRQPLLPAGAPES